VLLDTVHCFGLTMKGICLQSLAAVCGGVRRGNTGKRLTRLDDCGCIAGRGTLAECPCRLEI
jgi:hypothetical protein